MNINQLNTTGHSVSPQTAASSSVIKKSPAADLRIASVEFKATGETPESAEQVKQAVQKIQGSVDNLAQNLRFSVDEDTGKTIIKVVDAHTDELIRQIPTEEAVEIARTLDKVQGLLFNGKA